jgi:5-methylcytosine-specific restriction endonuclease McrA
MAACGRRGQIRRDLVRLPKGTCTWCGQPCKPPRRSWCSDDCVSAYNSTQPPTIAARVWARDRDKPCEVCHEGGRYREVDHRVPIIEGGHPFDLANLRLICSSCHRAETAALAVRRAERRRSA